MSDPEVWCVLTMKDGAVSILKGLTEDECRAVVQRIKGGNPWSQEAIHQHVLQSAGTGMSQQQNLMYAYQRQAVSGFGVDRCEWWGSKDGKLEVWPKPDDYDARLSAAMAVLATVERTNGAISKAAA